MNLSPSLLTKIRQCNLCEKVLPNPPNPVLQFQHSAKVMLIGQAPGIHAHQSNTPWNDASGKRLREWLMLPETDFYNSAKIAIVPMGFCYPGKGKSGDLPPRPECASTWHEAIRNSLPQLQMTLLIGQYAQQYYLKDKRTLTDRCRDWQLYAPKFLVFPHPSPRNNIWLKKNPWYEEEVIPAMRKQLHLALSDDKDKTVL